MGSSVRPGGSLTSRWPSYALVTGASRGLGLAFAARLLDDGAVVALGVRDTTDAAAADALAARHPGQARVLRADYADHATLRACPAESRLPRLDLLINCGAANTDPGRPKSASKGPLPQLDTASLAWLFEVNVAGPIALSQAMLPLLADARGTIVNVSTSRASISLVDQAGSFGYAVTKAAFNMATRKLAMELAPAGVTTVAVDPGWIRTRMGGDEAPRSPEDSARQILAVLRQSGSQVSGLFVDAHGERLPW